MHFSPAHPASRPSAGRFASRWEHPSGDAQDRLMSTSEFVSQRIGRYAVLAYERFASTTISMRGRAGPKKRMIINLVDLCPSGCQQALPCGSSVALVSQDLISFPILAVRIEQIRQRIPAVTWNAKTSSDDGAVVDADQIAYNGAFALTLLAA